MKYTRRLLGKRGRTTIPFDFRKKLGLKYNDVLTFALNDDKKCVVITKEKICTDCFKFIPGGKEISLDDFLSQMNREDNIASAKEHTKKHTGNKQIIFPTQFFIHNKTPLIFIITANKMLPLRNRDVKEME